MRVARVAIFDEAPLLRDDDERRAQSLRDLLQSAQRGIRPTRIERWVVDASF
jgi:hypothetical protein